MLARQLILAGIGVAAALSPAAAQRQSRLAEVPLYPGAAAYTPEEGGCGGGAELALPEGLDTTRAYAVRAPIEAVVRFYQERLSARELSDEEFAAYERGASEPTKAVFVVESYLSMSLMGPYERVRSRPPYRPGTWLMGATFLWPRPQGKERAVFGIHIVDHVGSFEGPPETHFMIGVGVLEVARAQAEPDAENRPVAEPAPSDGAEERRDQPRRPMSEPSAGGLGVPTYPGAKFDPQISGTISSNEEQYFVYATADASESVLAFYEQRTGKKATIKTEAGWLIPVRGEGPFPELGVAVQPNAGTYPASVKTVITIRRAQKK